MSGSPHDLSSRSALQWAALLASGALDASEGARRTLAAIESCEDKAIFTLPTPERAAALAAASAARQKAGRPVSLLDGVPVAYKDLFDLEGVPTTAGSRVLADAPPAARDAALVRNLEAAGMVGVGRVNMTEFAFSGIGLNPHYGTPVNPHGKGRVPGGSSSGSAMAVAKGLVPVAIGTDTGGSVRIPAAFNGVVGYKTSGGRWPMQGVFPLSRTLDTLGVFSRTVVDAVLVDAAARGTAAPDIRRAEVKGLRVVVPTTMVLDACDDAVLANFEASVARLAAAGALVERRPFPVFEEIMALSAKHVAIVNAEAYALHRERVEGEDAKCMDRRVAARIAMGNKAPLVAYAAVLEARQRLVAESAAEIEGSVVVMPSVSHVAPSIAALEADDDLFVRTNLKTLRNTLLGNFLDWCGVSIPNGTDAEGMPTGFLLSGAPGRDDHLLAVSMAAEEIVRGGA